MRGVFLAMVLALAAGTAAAGESAWDLPPLPAAPSEPQSVSAPESAPSRRPPERSFTDPFARAPLPAASPARTAPERPVETAIQGSDKHTTSVPASARRNPQETAKAAAPASPSGEADGSSSAGSLVGKIQVAFDKGGLVMWVLLAMSLLAFTFVFERLLGLRRGAQIPKSTLEKTKEFVEPKRVAEAKIYLSDKSDALSRVFSAVLSRDGAMRKELDQAVDEEVGRTLWDLRRNIRPVGIVASVAPLVGLLGTVLGMIAAFQTAAERGMDNPTHFAAGIYQALFTTAFGLTVAIPSLVMYHVLRGRAEALMREVEDAGLAFARQRAEAAGGGDVLRELVRGVNEEAMQAGTMPNESENTGDSNEDLRIAA